MMKKRTLLAIALLLMIPVVLMLQGLLFSMINPEIAAGHPNYARNYHLLNLVRIGSWLAALAVVTILWLLACFQVIRSKQRSPWWLFLAALGPLGFAILAALNDKTPGETDPYSRFVRSLNGLVRVGYEVCTFVILSGLAYQAMVLKRNLMILYESATTGVSAAQIIDVQNASSGMWAFGEGMEVIFMVVLLYLLRPIIFNIVARVSTMMAQQKAR
jgi:hypothetical protein